MSYSSINAKIVVSILSYLFLAFLVVISLKYNLFQDFLIYFLLSGTVLIIRDIIVLFGISNNIVHRVIDWELFWSDRRSHAITPVDLIVFINRVIFFPTILIFYIVLILLKQLDIFTFSDILLTNPWIEYGLLGCVAISGVLTVFHESIDDHYYKTVNHYGRTRGFIILTILLGLMGTAIISYETASLGLLSIPISIISGILIFLIGILLLEDDEKQSN